MVFGGKTQFVWHIHVSHGGDRELLAVEVGPREGGVMNWRLAVPSEAHVVDWGVGPGGNKGISQPRRAPFEGRKALLGQTAVLLYGAGDRLSEGLSAYVVFRKENLPPFVAFGQEDLASRPPTCMMERITFVRPAEEMAAPEGEADDTRSSEGTAETPDGGEAAAAGGRALRR